MEARRIGTVLFGRSALHDRNEEEIRGYREALRLIHEQSSRLDASEETIRRLHALIRGDIWDAGRYKEKDGDILERYPDGRERVRFRTVPAAHTPDFMSRLVDRWQQCLRERWVHPLLALGAFGLDFLCIHPFRDGNGRVSRLLLLLQLYHLGYEAPRYISLERVIEQNKERYYETLERSSLRWHEGKHDPWPYINFTLFVLKTLYREFEERVGEVKEPRGAKTETVKSAIERHTDLFSVQELERACPAVSRDLIRRVLKDLQNAGQVECLGRGPGARWRKRGITPEQG